MSNEIHSPSGHPGSSFPRGTGDDAGGADPFNVPSASSLQAALSVRDLLRAKLDAAKEALDELDVKRKEVAFDACVDGGGAAKILDKLNKDRLAQLITIETLQTAILEASRRVDDAERAEALAADGVKAEQALDIAADLVLHARAIDEALATVVEEGNAFRAALRILNHQLGCSHPTEHQLQVNGERAIKSAMMFSAFRLEHLAPHERHTFAELCEGWVATIARWAASLRREAAE
jgi:hypothetical protein